MKTAEVSRDSGIERQSKNIDEHFWVFFSSLAQATYVKNNLPTYATNNVVSIEERAPQKRFKRQSNYKVNKVLPHSRVKNVLHSKQQKKTSIKAQQSCAI